MTRSALRAKEIRQIGIRSVDAGKKRLLLDMGIEVFDTRGSPTCREVQLCIELVADTGQLASLDVVELNPALDYCNQSAELAVDLIESLFGKSTLMRS